jgi:hypothetical protein
MMISYLVLGHAMANIILSTALQTALDAQTTVEGKVASANPYITNGFLRIKRSGTLRAELQLSAVPLQYANGITTLNVGAGTVNAAMNFTSSTDTWEIVSSGGTLAIGPQVCLGPGETAPDPSVTPYLKMTKNAVRIGKAISAFGITFVWAGIVAPPPPPQPQSTDRYVGQSFYLNGRAPCQFPTAFWQEPNTLIESDAITITGLSGWNNVYGTFPALTHCIAQSPAQVSVNGGAYSSGEVAVTEGATIKMRIISSGLASSGRWALNFRQAGGSLIELAGWTYRVRNDSRAFQTFQVGPGKTYTTLQALPARVAGDIIEVDTGTTFQPAVIQRGTLTAVNQTVEFNVSGQTSIACCLSDVWVASVKFQQFNGTSWSDVACRNTRTDVAENQQVAGTVFVGSGPGTGRATDTYRIQIGGGITKIRVLCTSYTSGTVYASYSTEYVAFFSEPNDGNIGLPIIYRAVGAGARPIISNGGTANYGGAVAGAFDITGSNVQLEGFDIRCGFGDVDCALRIGLGYTGASNNIKITDCILSGRDPILSFDQGTGSIEMLRSEVANGGDTARSRTDFAHGVYIGVATDAWPNAQFKMTNCFVHDCEGNALKIRSPAIIQNSYIEVPDTQNAYYCVQLAGPQGPNTARNWEQIVTGCILVSKKSADAQFISFAGDGTSQSKSKSRVEKTTLIATALSYANQAGASGIVDSLLYVNCAYISAGSPPTQFRLVDNSGATFTNGIKLRFDNCQLPANYLIPDAAWLAATVISNAKSGITGITDANVNSVNAALPGGSPLLTGGQNMATYTLPAGYETTNQRRDFSSAVWTTRPTPGIRLTTPSTIGSNTTIGAI